jgi:hypothetical protein
MTLDDQTKKLLNRIRGDMPTRGDGEKLVKLLTDMELSALRKSKVNEDVLCRWRQGESMGYDVLVKMFEEAWKER